MNENLVKIERSGNEWVVTLDGYEMFRGTEAACREYYKVQWGR